MDTQNLTESELDLVFNALQSRSAFIERYMDPKRNYDKECGYPENIDIKEYKRYYDRDPIAARIVDCLPDETWKVQPEVYEDENTETVTAFEEAWDNLGRTLRGGSYYQDEKASPIWEYLNRLDRLCGIGSFGVLLFGFDDITTGETLEKPLPGFEESPEDGQPTIGTPPDGFPPESIPAGVPEPQGEGINLLFLRVFDESLVKILSYETNLANPRYGQPKLYELTFINPEDQTKGGVGLPLATQRVHWSRVLHVADNISSSEIFGDPRMRVVWNRLIDLRKLYGGSAEMFWKGAFPGLALEIDPKMGGDVPIDREGIRDAMFKYNNSLQRWFALAGVTAKSLSPQVADPTAQIMVHIEAICVKLAIPKRIFMGSERGELASSQDSGTWNDRLKHRQKMFVTPKIIIPFVDRLISAGVLPAPTGYSVNWEPLESMTPADKANVANTITTAMSTYVAGGLEGLIEPLDYLIRIIGLSEEEAMAILENRTTTLEDQRAAEEEQQALGQLGTLGDMTQEEQQPPQDQAA